MTTAPEPGFDLQAAHRHFSRACFNAAWAFIRLPARTPSQAEEMIRLAQASLWHWTQRSDCTPQNLSIGWWQLSRVYALAGRAALAREAGERSLQHAAGQEPFCSGYAHEALARAARLEGDTLAQRRHLDEARRIAASIEDEEDRSALLADLDSP